MTVRLFYVDESFDDRKFCLSAIGIRHIEWRESFARVRQHRTILKLDHGIFLRKKIRAHEFVSGRGRIAERIIGKHDRSRILAAPVENLRGPPRSGRATSQVMVINICLNVPAGAHPRPN